MDNIDNYMEQLKKLNETALYKLWECFACGKRFGHVSSLETHLRINHEELFQPTRVIFYDDSEAIRWSCSDCHIMFDDREMARLHSVQRGHVVRFIPPKPPLGLTPRFITDENRFSDIIEAMKRFRQAKQSIPDEWVDEMIEILDRREKKDATR